MKDMPFVTVQRIFSAPFQPAYDTHTRSYETREDALDAYFKARASVEAGLEPFYKGNLPVATAMVIITVCDENESVMETFKKSLPARENILKAWGKIEPNGG